MDGSAARRRARMVADLRSRGIRDERVLAAMAEVPREWFVPEHLEAEAYADRPLPIGEGQTISQPWIVAATCQAMQVGPDDRVLDVGTGSGYAAAVLAGVAGQVWSIERRPELAERAARTLHLLGVEVDVVVGDGSRGWPPAAPYAAIGVAAATPVVPPDLVAQLEDGGRLVVPVGDAGWQQLQVVVRRGDSTEVSSLGTVRFVPLVSDPE